MLGPHCRYQPTCSTYARVCIHRFGAVRGFWLALRRLLRCHPWGSFGFDPPPVVDISPIPHRSLKRP
ncbi:MAG: membrane protein insertion efficiency factor YidD [Myxococcota bacterium]|nr:membrane protein insertion efficiency factor YidD [Myxococcota bacterium]